MDFSQNDRYGLDIQYHRSHLFRFEGGFKFMSASSLSPYLAFNLVAEFVYNSKNNIVNIQGNRRNKFPINSFVSALWSAAPEVGWTFNFNKTKIDCSYKGMYNYAGSVQHGSVAISFCF